MVCVQAGNVNTGAVDPVGEICERAHASGAWVHVDGAFGLWAKASPSLAPLVAGVEQADSWATDAHKWLNVPYDSGLAFVRQSEFLGRAMTLTAAYIPKGARRDPGQFTPELSRRARGVEIWAALRSLGKSGLAAMIEGTCAHARHFAAGLRSAGCEILNDVVLNQVLVSFGDAETTLRVIDRIQQEGTCWCGGTTWQGRAAMRISVASWATTAEDVERSLEPSFEPGGRCEVRNAPYPSWLEPHSLRAHVILGQHVGVLPGLERFPGASCTRRTASSPGRSAPRGRRGIGRGWSPCISLSLVLHCDARDLARQRADFPLQRLTGPRAARKHGTPPGL